MPQSTKTRRYGDLIPLLFPLVAFLSFAVFAYADDYWMIKDIHWERFHWWHNSIVGEGRPLYAVWMNGAISLFPTLEGMLWIRLFGVLGIVVLAWTIARFAITACGLTPMKGRLLGTFLVLTPAVGVSAFWAVTAIFPWAAALSVGAGAMAWHGFRAPRSRWPRILGGMLVGFTSELIYQPAAGFFLLPPVLVVVLSTEREKIRAAVFATGLFAAILGLYFVLYKLATVTVLAGFPNIDRAGKLAWNNVTFYFFTTLPRMACSWGIFFPQPYAALFGAIMGGGGILWWIRHTFRQSTAGSAAERLLVVAGGIVLAGAPLLGSGDYSPFRTLGAAYAVMLAPIAIGWYRSIPARIRRHSAISIAAVLGVALFARVIVQNNAIEPFQAEYRALRAEIAKLPTPPSRITALMPEPLDPRTRLFRPLDEYGSFGSNSDWQTRNMVRVALAERFAFIPDSAEATLLLELTPIIAIKVSPTETLHVRGDVVELGRTLGQAAVPRVLPDPPSPTGTTTFAPLGTVEQFPSGWCYLAGFGAFRPGPDGWIQHEDLDWMRIIESDGNGFYAYSRLFGKLTGYIAYGPVWRMHDFKRTLDLRAFAASRNVPGGYAEQLIEEIAASKFPPDS